MVGSLIQFKTSISGIISYFGVDTITSVVVLSNGSTTEKVTRGQNLRKRNVCVTQCAIDAVTSSKITGEGHSGISRNMQVSMLQCLPALCVMLLLSNITFCTDAQISTELSLRKVSAERAGIVGTILTRIREILDFNPCWDAAYPD